MVHPGTVVYGHDERRRSRACEMWFTLMVPRDPKN